MSSLIRRLQRKMLTKQGVLQVPIRQVDRKKPLGFRHRLCAAHIGYLIDGTPLLAPVKPKRVRKPRATSTAA